MQRSGQFDRLQVVMIFVVGIVDDTIVDQFVNLADRDNVAGACLVDFLLLLALNR